MLHVLCLSNISMLYDHTLTNVLISTHINCKQNIYFDPLQPPIIHVHIHVHACPSPQPHTHINTLISTYVHVVHIHMCMHISHNYLECLLTKNKMFLHICMSIYSVSSTFWTAKIQTLQIIPTLSKIPPLFLNKYTSMDNWNPQTLSVIPRYLNQCISYLFIRSVFSL